MIYGDEKEEGEEDEGGGEFLSSDTGVKDLGEEEEESEDKNKNELKRKRRVCGGGYPLA